MESGMGIRSSKNEAPDGVFGSREIGGKKGERWENWTKKSGRREKINVREQIMGEIVNYVRELGDLEK